MAESKAAEQSKEPLKSSKLGIVSIFMPIIFAALVFLYYFLLSSYDYLSLVFEIVPWLVELIFAIPIIGLILAIIDLRKENRNKLFPIVGAIFNSITIIVEAFVFIWAFIKL